MGRKKVLVAGWWVAIPVPFLLMWAPSWGWILVANFFLGVSQGLTWSTTVIMKIDLVGPQRRGFAMGLNEFAGYFAVALSALATGWIASRYGLRPNPFYLGVFYVFAGLALSFVWVRETRGHAELESVSRPESKAPNTWRDPNLSAITQAGLVNNLNDGMAWGLFPIWFSSKGMTLEQIGWLAGIYPAVWGLLQLYTGHLSDRLGRKGLIAWGMWVQAAAIGATLLATDFWGFATGAALLGIGTAMVYPTLLAAIGDVAHPSWRATSVGVYRFWRDAGYAVGALLAGVIADVFGLSASIGLVAALTFGSGVVVTLRMTGRP